MVLAKQLKQYEQAFLMLVQESDRAHDYMQQFGRHASQPGPYKYTAAALAIYAVEDVLSVAARLHRLALELNDPARIANAKQMLDGLNGVCTEFKGIVQQALTIDAQQENEKLAVQFNALAIMPDLKFSNRDTSRYLPLFSQLEAQRNLAVSATQASTQMSKRPGLNTTLIWTSGFNANAIPFEPSCVSAPIPLECKLFQ